MPGIEALIAFIVVIVAVIVISTKMKMNIGVLGLLAAYLVGTWVLDLSSSEIVAMFPTNIFMTQFLLTMFFGFANQTGLFKVLIDRLVHKTGGKAAALPFILLLCGAIVRGAGGAAEATPLVMSPVAFAMVSSAGLSPLFAVTIVYWCSIWGAVLPWTNGPLNAATIAAFTDEATGQVAANIIALTMTILFVVMFILTYFACRCNRLRGSTVDTTKPEPFTRDQKIAGYIIIGFVALILLPAVINNFFPNPVTQWIATNLHQRILCLIGIFLYQILKVGDAKDCLQNRVPWGPIIMICGMSTLVTVGVEWGVIDTLAEILSESMPAFLFAPAIVLVGALMSFVTSGTSIWPMLFPVAAALAAENGLNAAVLCACVFMSTQATGLCPLSMGGTMAAFGADDETRRKLFGPQTLMAAVGMIFTIILTLIGGFEWFA